MSSKKELRRRRAIEERERSKPKVNSALIFVLVAVAALLVIVGVAYLLYDPGEPPWPGAVWSSLHGHWH
jgi:hypothetical protein